MGRRGCWAAVIGIAAAVGLATPALAGETTFDDTCTDVYGHRAAGDLEKTTDPVAGSTVVSGQGVSISLSWPTFAVAGARQSRVIECLSVDGSAPRLWAERLFTTSEGTVTFSAVVPDGLNAKSTLCGQSFLKTRGSFGPVTRWSDKTCFPAAGNTSFHALSRVPSPPSEESAPKPESRSTPTTRGPLFSSPPSSPPSGSYQPPSSGEYQPPWPPWEKAPKVAESTPVTTTPTTTKAATVPTRKAQGNQAAAPSTGVTRQPSQTLPRTGAGVVVLIGVAAVALFSGRTLRKTAHHIEDNLPVDAVPVDEDEPTLVLGRRW